VKPAGVERRTVPVVTTVEVAVDVAMIVVEKNSVLNMVTFARSADHSSNMGSYREYSLVLVATMVSVDCCAVVVMVEVKVSVRVVVCAFGVIVFVVCAQAFTKAVNGNPIVLVDVGTFFTDETPSLVLQNPSVQPALTMLADCKVVAMRPKVKRMAIGMCCAWLREDSNG